MTKHKLKREYYGEIAMIGVMTLLIITLIYGMIPKQAEKAFIQGIGNMTAYEIGFRTTQDISKCNNIIIPQDKMKCLGFKTGLT
jgi:hypothetical protein